MDTMFLDAFPQSEIEQGLMSKSFKTINNPRQADD